MAAETRKKPAPAAKSPNCRWDRWEKKSDWGVGGGASRAGVDVDEDSAIENGCWRRAIN